MNIKSDLMFVVDGEDCILGRLSAQVAKKALNGETVQVINAEKIFITGSPTQIVARWKQKLRWKDVSDPERASPRVSRRPDLFVKKTIRGMIPRKKAAGREALERIKVFIGKPEGVKGVKVAEAKSIGKGIYVGDLCRQIGWKG